MNQKERETHKTGNGAGCINISLHSFCAHDYYLPLHAHMLK